MLRRLRMAAAAAVVANYSYPPLPCADLEECKCMFEPWICDATNATEDKNSSRDATSPEPQDDKR